MKEFGFKKEQIERIYALLSNLNECNTKFNSNCKVKAIQMYVDNENNFVCTYLYQSLGSGDGLVNEIKYVMITPSGEKVNLLDVYSSKEAIQKGLETMKIIEI